MNLTSTQAKKVLAGSQTFSQLGFSMLITRLKGVYAKDPSPAVLENCTSEMNAFLKKFEAIMAKDFAVIAKL